MGRSSADTVALFKAHPGWAARFHVIRLLGEGSAGSVYHVLDGQRESAEMALKILVNKKAFDENTLLRFKREIEVCQRVRHPNLVEAYDLLEECGSIAFTMEFVSGLDLGKICARARLEYAEINRVIEQLLDALSELHRQSIVHRDVKLENIMMRHDGIIKLGDLGLVKLCDAQKITRTGILLGTAQYMPPEYIRYNRYEPAGDVYAAGVAIYEMLTGRRRLAGLTGVEAIQELFKTDFNIPREPLLSVPERYLRLLDVALCSNPKKRYQNADEMLRAFRGSLASNGSPELQSSPGLAIRNYSEKKPRRGLLGALRRIIGR